MFDVYTMLSKLRLISLLHVVLAVTIRSPPTHVYCIASVCCLKHMKTVCLPHEIYLKFGLAALGPSIRLP